MNQRILAILRMAAGAIRPGGPRRWLIGCLLLGLTTPSAAQMPAARVVVAVVQQRELTTGQTFVGTVMPLRSSTVGSTVEGRVDELAVREGDQVREKQKLARLRTRQLEIQLAAGQAELEVRRQELADLKISLPAEIEEAKARVLAAKALMEFATARLKRFRGLFARSAVSESELQEVESAAVAAQQKYLENQVAWQLAVKVLPHKIQQAQAKVNAQVEEVHRLEDDIAEHTIVAPFDGYVTREHTEVGQWIAKGAPVVDVVELSHVDVEVSVLESYVQQLRVGMKAPVDFGALPGGPWEGEVVAIVPQADVRSRSFPVQVRLKNRPGPGGVLLKPGMFARVTLPVGDNPQALLVPKDAVVLGGETPAVFVVDPAPKSPPPQAAPPDGGSPADPAPDGTARKVPVELREAKAGLIEVRGELQPGDRVAVEGNERLFSGCPVTIINRDQTPPGKPAASPPK